MMRHYTNSRWPSRLATICTALSRASAAWATNLRSVTFPTPVYVGQPFTITVTSTSENQTPLTFSVQGCSCSVFPPMAVYVAQATVQTFTVTIFSPDAVSGAIFRVAYDTGTVSSSPFNLIFAPAQQLNVQVQGSASVGESFDVRIAAQDTAGNIAAGFNQDVTLTAALSGTTSTIQVGPTPLMNGIGNIPMVLNAVGTWQITASGGGLTSNAA